MQSATVDSPANPDPFGGTPANWSLSDWTPCPTCGNPMPADPWPPIDPDRLQQLNRWMDEQEEIMAAELAAERNTH